MTNVDSKGKEINGAELSMGRAVKSLQRVWMRGGGGFVTVFVTYSN